MSDEENKTGLIIVNTGDGKGKTTAALGICVRAVGYDMKVAIVQFIKGSWHYGEIDGIKKLAPNIELFAGGKGFVGIVEITCLAKSMKKPPGILWNTPRS